MLSSPRGGRMIKLDHLTIAVSDCEKSRDWYMETLGLKLEFEIPERRTSAVQDEFGFTLFLAETPGGPGRPSCVLTFQVSDVVAIQVFQHGAQPDTESYFARTAAVLKAGGLFFLRVNSAKGPRAGTARK